MIEYSRIMSIGLWIEPNTVRQNQRQEPRMKQTSKRKSAPKAKKETKKTVNRDEFRKLNTKEGKGHPHYVCGKKGSRYQSVGITHAKKTKGKPNLPLTKNPDPKDSGTAYVRPVLTEEKEKNYGRRLDGLGLGKEDKEKVWKLIEELRKKKTKK